MVVVLNEEQTKAVEHSGGPAIIQACPGTGKTIVICKRYKHLVETLKVDHKKIWIIADRFLKLEEDSHLEDPTSVNLYGFCKNLLLELGIFDENKLEIYTVSKQKNIITQIIFKQNLLIPDECEKYILSFINRIKTKLTITEDEAKKIFEYDFFETTRSKKNKNHIDFESAWQVFTEYEKHNKNQQLDWHSILKKTLTEVENPNAQEWIKNNVEHMLFDEFQDTNEIQLELIKKIYKYCPNIFLFGDSNQSIKTFSGTVKNVFEKFDEFTGNSCVHYCLNHNYRLPKNIAEKVNKIFGTNIVSLSKEKGLVKIETLEDIQQEEDCIIDEIQQLTHGEEYVYSTFAVLNRTNYDSQNMCERMTQKCTSIEFELFHQNAEICDEFQLALTFLYIWSFDQNNPQCDKFKFEFYKFWADREEDCDLTPKNFDNLNEYAKNYGKFKLEWFSEIPKVIKGFSEKDYKSAKNFHHVITTIKSVTSAKDIYDLVRKIWNTVYLKDFSDKYNNLSKGTKQTISQLLNKYLSNTSLSNKDEMFNIINNCWSKNKKKTSYNLQSDKKRKVSVRCCTIHNSQGEQYDYVFVAGLTEGNIPISFAIQPTEREDKISEEKQLFYVACSRATKGLYFLITPRRSEENNKPSRFLDPLLNGKQQN